ncbi:MAG: hypothetical protein FWE74_03190 [Oscillospiraceae bacterium]|nr:hypothetical protein [Oscillospiraceae bacterium]
MAKKGMKRPETDFMKPPLNEVAPVEELQGKAKFTKQEAIKSSEAQEAQVPRIPKNRNYLNQYR